MTRRIAVQIAPDDNVVTVVEDAAPGDDVHYMTPQGPCQITALDAVPMGHKVALDDVAPGEPILKYSQPIGTAATPIDKGRHVHVHNVQSGVQGMEQTHGAEDED